MSEPIRTVIQATCPVCGFECSARSREAAVEGARGHERFAQHSTAPLSWPIGSLEFYQRPAQPGGRE